MNFLRRELAPISQQAWSQIDSMAKDTLAANLAGRRFLDVDGPHGLEFASVPLGRLSVPENQGGSGIKYGIHQVLPLVESRVSFSLKTWELDNLERGAKDIQLEPVVESCREIAAFEDKAVFDGFEPSGIVGMSQMLKGRTISMALERDAVIDAVSEGQARLLKEGIGGAAYLAVSEPLWKFLAHSEAGKTLRSLVEAQIGGAVVLAPLAKDAVLVAVRGGDLTLTVGQDFSIGYHSHTPSEINLFVTESFTFRVTTPEAFVGLTLKKNK